jgi:hypothetical protein
MGPSVTGMTMMMKPGQPKRILRKSIMATPRSMPSKRIAYVRSGRKNEINMAILSIIPLLGVDNSAKVCIMEE